MCRNHSHATVLKRGQVVLTEVGELVAYSLVGDMKLELPTGEYVTLPPSTIFFVPSSGWAGLLMWELPQTEALTTAGQYSMAADVLSQPTTPTSTTKG